MPYQFPLTRSMLCLLLGLSVPASALAGPQSRGEPANARPQLENYADPDEFISDVLAWQQQQRSAKSADTAADEQEPANNSGSWHNITGPEKLDEAIRKAYGYTPPDYKARYRFNRTTHLSFPLPRLESSQMSGQAITGGLRRETIQERSLKPLPELRSILNETEKREDLSIAPRQQAPRNEGDLNRQSVRFQAR